jgi:hypothetical protein
MRGCCRVCKDMKGRRPDPIADQDETFTCRSQRSRHTAGGRRAWRSAAVRELCTGRRRRRAARPPGTWQLHPLLCVAGVSNAPADESVSQSAIDGLLAASLSSLPHQQRQTTDQRPPMTACMTTLKVAACGQGGRGRASMRDSGWPCGSQGGEAAWGIGSPRRSASNSSVSRSCSSTGVEFWLPATQQDSLQVAPCLGSSAVQIPQWPPAAVHPLASSSRRPAHDSTACRLG